MISKQRIADIILERATQGDPYAQEVVKLSDKLRVDSYMDIDIKEIEPYLLPFLKQSFNQQERYFTARALNHFIFNGKNKPEQLKENIHWIRGCSKLLTSIFGTSISRNRFNTRQCLVKWRQKIKVFTYMETA